MTDTAPADKSHGREQNELPMNRSPAPGLSLQCAQTRAQTQESSPMSRISGILLLMAVLGFPPAHAVDTDEPRGTSAGDPEYSAGRKAIEEKNWQRAIELLNKAAQKDPRNADIHNNLGYAYRQAKQLPLAFKQYEIALTIDPNHRGAHEYIGEAYLMVNNLPKAEEHQAKLEQLCFFPCEELTDLRAKIVAYKKNAK